MTHLKKSLAVLLAIVMVFSSMSIAASAFDPKTEGGFELKSTVKFFRMERNADGLIIDKNGNVVGDKNDVIASGVDVDDDINWIETTTAKPGEKVKARVYTNTDYYTYSGNSAFLFDSNFLSSPSFVSGSTRKLETNSKYMDGSVSFTINSAGWFDGAADNAMADYLVSVGTIPADFFDGYDMITHEVQIATTSRTTTLLSDSDWMYEIDLAVNDNTHTRTIGQKGTAEVPEELVSNTTDGYLFVSYPKSNGSINTTNNMNIFGMQLWDADYTSVEGVLTTTGGIVLDANTGYYNDSGVYSVEKTLSGIIGDQVTELGAVVPAKDGYAHLGWSEVAIPAELTFTADILEALDMTEEEAAAQGNVLTAAQVEELMYDAADIAALKYGYENKTLYAVWSATEASDNYYTYNIFYMGTDGEYPATPDYSQQIVAAVGETATLLKTPVEGFTLNEELSDDSVLVKGDKSSVLNAYYARNKYTVTYNYSDNSGVAQTQDYEVFFGADVPDFDYEEFSGGVPNKEGFTFTGWADANGNDAPATMPSSNVDLFAQFEKKTYTYVFDAGDGGKFESNGERTVSYLYEYGATPEDFDEIPVFPGKEFIGWSAEIPATVTSDMTFVADYSDVEYTIIFKDDNDTLLEIPYFYGDIVYSEDVPEGYKAENSWKDANGDIVEFPYTVTGDATFTAVDESNVFNADFYVDGELFESVPTVFGEEIDAPEAPEKTGYTFLMWDPEVGAMDEEGKSFNAIYEVKETTISFADTGDTQIPSITGDYGTPVNANVPTPTKAGFTFAGWNAAIPSTMPAEDMVITALWTRNSYSIRFENYNGSLIDVVTAPYESPVTAPDLPVEAGYLYEWETAVPATMPAENTTIKAVRTPLKFSITFDTNGGTPAEIPAISDVDCGAPITKPEDPTKEGFTFGGWANVNAPAETPIVFPETMPAGGLSLKAIWNTNSHKAVFDAAGGVFADGTSTMVSANIKYGDPVVAPAQPTREGYIFNGWNPVPDKMIDDDMLFIAQWIPDASGSVEYKINVVTINPANGNEITQTVITNKAADGSTVAIIKNGETSTATHVYTYEELIDSVSNVLDEDRTTVTEMTVKLGEENVLTVYCKLADVTVTFLANGGKFDDNSDTAKSTGKYGAEIVAPADPTRTGYKFAGWDKEVEGATYTTAETYVAQWEAETYYAIFTINGETYAEVPYKFGETIVAPDYTPNEGETFSGWNVPTNTVMGPGNMTFDAKLTVNEYTLSYSYSFAPTGADVPGSVSGLKYNDTVTLADAPEIDGYTFNGWKYNNTIYNEGDSFTMPNSNAALVGSYTAIEYDITYDTGASDVDVPASAVTSATVGETITLPELVRDGYTFGGWEYNKATYSANAAFTMPADDVEFTAIWTANPGKNSVVYSWSGDIPAGVTLPETQESVVAGTEVTVADAPKADGYTFDGWYYNGKITESFVMPENAVTITGTWTKDEVPPTKYSFKLDAADGEFADGSEVYTAEFEENQTIVTPGEPTRDGYKFAGWVDANGNAASIPATMPANPIDLKADWSELYDVTYVVDGEIYDIAIDAGVEGADLPAPSKGNPEKDGWNFIGWADANGNTVTTIPAGDIRVNAVWEEIIPDTYTLNYYDGSTLLNSVQYEEDADIADYAPAAKEGYTFNGWTGMPEDGKMPAENLNVFANWEVNKYDITLDAGEGEFDDKTSIFTESDVPYGSSLSDIVPDEPTREGYDFVGWENAEGEIVNIPTTMPDEEIDLKAKWEIKEITVTFDAGEGKFADGSSTAEDTGDYKSDITLPDDPTRNGFIFKGWEGLPEDGKMPAEDITVTAIWEAEVVTYTLTIDAAGGTVNGEAKIVKELAAGESIGTVADPVREGYVFKGWDKTIPSTMPAEDYTVTAIWEEEEKPAHTITYYLAEGGEVFATGSYKEGEAMTHPTPVAEGIVFAEGWVDADGNPIPDVMGKEDIKAYAQIDHFVSYKATFIVDGSKYDEFTVTYGSEIPTPATDPAKEGYLFAGWRDANGNAVADTMPAKDVTYTAMWEKAPVIGKEFVAKYTSDGKTYALYVLEEGDTIPVPAAPTKFGYVFVGWEPEVPSTMPAEDMEFVAQWEIDKTFVTIIVGGAVISGAVIGTSIGINSAIITGVAIIGGIIVIVSIAELVKHTHTVTYLVDGEVYKTYKVVEGTKIPVPADPAKEGAEFAGWEPEVPEKMGDSDLVFEATWASESDVLIPDTGSAAGIAAFAAIAGAAAAAYVIISKKKKNDEE